MTPATSLSPEHESIVQALRNYLLHYHDKQCGVCGRCGKPLYDSLGSITLRDYDGIGWSVFETQTKDRQHDVLRIALKSEDPRFVKYEVKEGGPYVILCADCKELAVKYFLIESKRKSTQKGVATDGPVLL
jgi:hypothetical protein